jgi:hypothetical protein
MALYLRSDLSSRVQEDKDAIASVRIAERYFSAALFFIIMVAVLSVDILLLKRLKLFYPNFYKKERGKVIIVINIIYL